MRPSPVKLLVELRAKIHIARICLYLGDTACAKAVTAEALQTLREAMFGVVANAGYLETLLLLDPVEAEALIKAMGGDIDDPEWILDMLQWSFRVLGAGAPPVRIANTY